MTGAAERALGGVVGRLDAVDGGEGPERGPDLEQVVGELAVPAGAPALRAGVLRAAARSSVWIGAISACEPVAVVVLVLVGAPGGEHAAGELEAVLAEGLLLGQPVGVAAEVALEVRPAHLALVGSRWL